MKSPDTIKLKVCGMRDPDNIRAVSLLSPDYMGFIFYKDSKRFVGDDFEVPSDFSTGISRVGVFVNESTKEMRRLADNHLLTFIQLHGNEPVSQCIELKMAGLGVIKVFSIDDSFDFQNLKPYESHVDFFMFDTKGKYFGGNGVAFNWQTLTNYSLETPYFLSGGISPTNVKEIRSINKRNLHALDINSGVERSIAMKDIDMIKHVMNEKAKIDSNY